MKFFLIASCLVAAAWCAPAAPLAPVASVASVDHSLRVLPALRHEEVHDEHGQYALRYITAENTVVSERGWLVPTENGGLVLMIEGQYQYVGDDGQIYVTHYRGGPEGFHVDAKHLPQPVPVPVIPVAK